MASHDLPRFGTLGQTSKTFEAAIATGYWIGVIVDKHLSMLDGSIRKRDVSHAALICFGNHIAGLKIALAQH